MEIMPLSMLNRIEEAENILKNALKNNLIDKNIDGIYPFYLMKGDYITAGEILTAYSKTGFYTSHAFRLLIAGLIYELSGDKTKAKEVWKEVIGRFPLNRINYYASLAEALLNNTQDDYCLKNIPYNFYVKSELYYLMGLLYESRGKKTMAKEFFELSINADPSNWWPAYLAKKKLGK